MGNDASAATYLFHRVFHDISENPDISGLSNSLDPSNGLRFNHWIPLWFKNIYTISNCKVETTDVS